MAGQQATTGPAARRFLTTRAVATLASVPFVTVLASAMAALLDLVTGELLVETHEVPVTPVMAGIIFAGVLALLLIESVT